MAPGSGESSPASDGFSVQLPKKGLGGALFPSSISHVALLVCAVHVLMQETAAWPYPCPQKLQFLGCGCSFPMNFLKSSPATC